MKSAQTLLVGSRSHLQPPCCRSLFRPAPPLSAEDSELRALAEQLGAMVAVTSPSSDDSVLNNLTRLQQDRLGPTYAWLCVAAAAEAEAAAPANDRFSKLAAQAHHWSARVLQNLKR